MIRIDAESYDLLGKELYGQKQSKWRFRCPGCRRSQMAKSRECTHCGLKASEARIVVLEAVDGDVYVLPFAD